MRPKNNGSPDEEKLRLADSQDMLCYVKLSYVMLCHVMLRCVGILHYIISYYIIA